MTWHFFLLIFFQFFGGSEPVIDTRNKKKSNSSEYSDDLWRKSSNVGREAYEGKKFYVETPPKKKLNIFSYWILFRFRVFSKTIYY